MPTACFSSEEDANAAEAQLDGVERLLGQLPEKTRRLIRDVKIEGLSTPPSRRPERHGMSGICDQGRRPSRPEKSQRHGPGRRSDEEPTTSSRPCRRTSSLRRRRAVGSRLALGLGVGAVLSVVVMVLWLGVRADLMPAMMTGPFWMGGGCWMPTNFAKTIRHRQRNRQLALRLCTVAATMTTCAPESVCVDYGE